MTKEDAKILIDDLSNCVSILVVILATKSVTDEEKARLKYVTKSVDTCNKILEND